MKNDINLKKIVVIVFGFIFLAVVILGGLHILESTVFNNETEEVPEASKTVEKGENKYFPRQDITTVLFIGVDEDGPVKEKDPNSSTAYADVVVLVIFDEANKKVNAISLNRDSMVEMAVLGENGKRKGTFFGQLAFAHSFGNGLEESCENTVWTVSDLLNGIQIDYYISLNMGGISVINDAVGGVTVNVTDDFSEIGSSIPKGEYTLFGDEAETFVRARRGLGDSLNLSRMERQEEYLYGFINSVNKKMEESDTFVVELFEKSAEYMVTDCSLETLSFLVRKFEEYELCEIVSPKGENVLGKNFYEFYIDEEDLERITLEYLYVLK